jgi:hypothetical protein
MKEYKMVGDLQRPNSSLILTVGKMPLAVKELLIKFFFEEVKISRQVLAGELRVPQRSAQMTLCITIKM